MNIVGVKREKNGARWLAARLTLVACGLVALACGLTACQTPTYPPTSSLNVVDSEIPPAPAALREGDVIQVSFATSTNLNVTQRIPLDGQLSMQFIGKVKASGQTPHELEKTLEKMYEPQLRGAEPITVTLVTSAAAVYVSGAVVRPGKIPLDRPMTVLDAVMEAGGVDANRAKLSGVTVLRVENGRRISRRVNLKKALEGKDATLLYLKPYDTVYVPEKVINF
ncbi:MAG TPA: polysaccharide biosynthesis/export family protein [Candidatus Binatia bacterium]|nr:polysaccharide biosynthesis/export family protein [Candidatus Binatia bacterium]